MKQVSLGLLPLVYIMESKGAECGVACYKGDTMGNARHRALKALVYRCRNVLEDAWSHTDTIMELIQKKMEYTGMDALQMMIAPMCMTQETIKALSVIQSEILNVVTAAAVEYPLFMQADTTSKKENDNG